MTVDESSSFRWEDSTTDNGVELSHVEATSEYVITQLDIPFFGWLNSTLTMPFTVEQNQIPLGCYFQLTTEDGTVLSPSSSVPPDTSLLDYTGYKGDGSLSGALVFEAPPEGTSQLVLTLYEYPTALSGIFGWDYDPAILDTLPQKNRVTAEFTIDLEEGRVYASQNYTTQGRQKLDYRLSAGLDRAPAWENGYIAGELSGAYSPSTVLFYVQEEDYRPVELRFYWAGQLISSTTPWRRTAAASMTAPVPCRAWDTTRMTDTATGKFPWILRRIPQPPCMGMPPKSSPLNCTTLIPAH